MSSSNIVSCALGLIVVAWLSACSSPMNPVDASNCPSGGTAACTCDGGSTGTATCSANGQRGACVCANPGDSSLDVGDAAPADVVTDVPRDVPRDTANCDLDNDSHLAAACGGDDCDDNDPERHPGAIERCDGHLPSGRDAVNHDEDCNPCTVFDQDIAGDGDHDHDGYPSILCVNPWIATMAPTCGQLELLSINAPMAPATLGTVTGNDCNDDPMRDGASVHPAQVDVCNNSIDDNCDGNVDEAVPGTVYRDADNDLRGDPAITMDANLCSIPLGWVRNSEDCDDTNALTFQGAREICDGRDNDCSLPAGMTGGADPSEDADGDGHSAPTAMCAGRGDSGVVGTAYPRDDCDDTRATVFTGAMEQCGNGIDDNCNGVIDEAMITIYTDADGDGHGAPATARTWAQCALPAGTAALGDDCDDTAIATFTGAPEVCDGRDNDCSTGGGNDPLEDADNDGHSPTAISCLGAGDPGAAPGAFPRDDCNDLIATVHPGALEVCDRIDDDCSDPTTPGGLATNEDADNDGHAPIGAPCAGLGDPGAPSSAFPKDDCNDASAAAFPGAGRTEVVCDGVDNDCNASTSELTRPCSTGGTCGAGGRCFGGLELAIVQLVAGTAHTCALLNDGTARCWGSNSSGALGDGTTTDRLYPTPVSGLTGAVQLAAGSGFTCARIYDGTVRCWGNNPNGQLGDGTTTMRSTPVTVGAGGSPLTGATDIAAGFGHACAAMATGRVMCWGFNMNGGLGDGTAGTNRLTPVAALGVTTAVGVATGNTHSCARLSDGTAACWGGNSAGQLGDGTTASARLVAAPVVTLTGIAEIRAGSMSNNTCARRNDGRMFCWGSDSAGQVGDGTSVFGSVRPTPTMVLSLTNATQIASGETHECALGSDSVVRCWGNNNAGQVGDGVINSTHSTPYTITTLPAVVEIAAGYQHTCARLADNTVRCWGLDGSGQIGDGSSGGFLTRPSPTATRGMSNVVEITAGSTHSCARLLNSTVSCWGDNQFNQVQTFGTRWPTPQAVAGLGAVVQLVSGYSHNCARISDGTVQCWGNNQYGQIGNGMWGTGIRQATPVAVPGLTGVAQIVAGSRHTCARLSSGGVSCWGDNESGQIGDGTGTPTSSSVRPSPTPVPGITTAVDLASGQYHVCARLSSGAVQCWGSDSAGEIGDGGASGGMRVSPTTATVLTGVGPIARMSLGGSYSRARLTDGTLLAWGSNSYGQIGDGSGGAPVLTPVAIDSVVTAAGDAAGYGQACSWFADGSLRCWGWNMYGQIGDGTTLNRSTPTVVPGIGSVVGVAAGGYHTCAMTYLQTACWGYNTTGQIGNGTTIESHTPQAVSGL